MKDFIDRKIASGRYTGETQVIHEALYRLRQEEPHRPISNDELRGDIRAGLEASKRGETYVCSTQEELDAFFEDVNRRGHERLIAQWVDCLKS